MQRYRTLLEAIYRLYEHSGFAMAGAVAFSFVVSLFPFCIFLGALAGIFGGRELAAQAVEQLFQILPQGVAAGLAPQIEAIMGRTRIDLLTVSAGLSLFFATNAIETLRTALNGAYRVIETRPYLLCLLRSMVFVFASAVSMLVLTWVVVVGPGHGGALRPDADPVVHAHALDLGRRHLPLRVGRRRHRRAAARLPPVARGGAAAHPGRLARRAAIDGVVAGSPQAFTRTTSTSATTRASTRVYRS